MLCYIISLTSLCQRKLTPKFCWGHVQLSIGRFMLQHDPNVSEDTVAYI